MAELDLSKFLFVGVESTILFATPNNTSKKNRVNHLIFGDFATFDNETNGEWIKINCRGNDGWVKKKHLTNKRILEINFVDIGQGDGCHIVTPDDKIILIDAGEGLGFHGDGGDNMARFLNWRYNLRYRPDDKKPVDIEYAIMSHPDLDHYYGFLNVFGNKKLKVQTVGHNGIMERSSSDIKAGDFNDLGAKVKKGKVTYLTELAQNKSDITDLFPASGKLSRKYLLETLQTVNITNPAVSFKFLNKDTGYLPGYSPSNPLTFQILGPVTEHIDVNGQDVECLRVLKSNEGKTKNGHSVVFMVQFNKARFILGGDLNVPSQDYLGRHYTGIAKDLSKLEKDVRNFKVKLRDSSLSSQKRQAYKNKLETAEKTIELMIAKLRETFQCDLAKACHHGSTHVTPSFLKGFNPIATVISSGDKESHSHPRPDALGMFGKTSRGLRPLIFSTELARNTKEFSYPETYYNRLKELHEELDNAADGDKESIQLKIDTWRDSNVAKYGMITVRTDGEDHFYIAQKLEEERNPGEKWDIYALEWDEDLQEYEYIG
ncbi:hypothetical protein [Seonamhaeicola sp.]|uniref:ComEC/Rec2 family competence protein n=1 Tax=Seonamhaeicola sp. TaxID=1912245 RepID=UPI00261271A1|nr:hypothetical protein [Seonamhaeicola sp.]